MASRVGRIGQLIIVVIMITVTFQLFLVELDFYDTVSAAGSRMEYCKYEIDTSTCNNIDTSNDKIKLSLKNEFIKDDFTDETKIALKNNLIVDTTEGKVKLDQLRKTYGGTNWDEGHYIKPTNDGGYIIGGTTFSYGAGNSDMWLIKTDSSGTIEWSQTFGGSEYEQGGGVLQTIDGGYVIVGYTDSYGAGYNDVWLIKTNSNGVKLWDKTYGGSYDDYGYEVQQTTDGGFIIVGTSDSYSTGFDTDVYLIKTDSAGGLTWDYTYGGTENEEGYSVSTLREGGYIVAGYTESYGTGDSDCYLIKIDSSGNEVWSKNYGGGNNDMAYSVKQTAEGGFIFTGETRSYGSGTNNMWLYKTDANGNKEWDRTFTENNYAYAMSIDLTADGGYIIAGATLSSNLEMMIVKTDSGGYLDWKKQIQNNENDIIYSILQESDGCYIITGFLSDDSFGYQVCLLKLNQDGDYNPPGELISINLLKDEKVYSIDAFKYTAVIPANTKVRVQFSRDSGNWSNSNGESDIWDDLIDGTNSISLTKLLWNTSFFYYKLSLSSSGEFIPAITETEIDYSNYHAEGSAVSEPISYAENLNLKNLSWSADTPKNSQVKFQFRSSTVKSYLSKNNFVGPEGTKYAYYSTSPSSIWEGHEEEYWFQFKIYLSSDCKSTPVVHDIDITLAEIPMPPELIDPEKDYLTNDSQPEFSWELHDRNTDQIAFQVLIDDDTNFKNVKYDSGEQKTDDLFWEFPEGTSYEKIKDGIWYWKVRIKNSDGEWSEYSLHRKMEIDTVPPEKFYIEIDYGTDTFMAVGTYSSNAQPSLEFSTTDRRSGISHYILKISEGKYSRETSPYSVPLLKDGKHPVSVRAHDKAGNYRESNAEILIDTDPPSIIHNQITNAKEGDDLDFTARVEDELSGILRVSLYTKNAEQDQYSRHEMILVSDLYTYTMPGEDIKSDFEYYIEATDRSEPANVNYYGSYGETEFKPDSDTDLDITVEARPSSLDSSLSKADERSIWPYIAAFMIIIIVIMIIVWQFVLKEKQEPKEKRATQLYSGYAQQPYMAYQSAYPTMPQQQMMQYQYPAMVQQQPQTQYYQQQYPDQSQFQQSYYEQEPAEYYEDQSAEYEQQQFEASAEYQNLPRTKPADPEVAERLRNAGRL